MAHKVEAKNQGTHCVPDVPAPQQAEEYCEGTFRMEKCCCNLNTRTFILNIGPQSESNLITFLQNTVNAYESGGYVIIGHSVTDIGAGWLFALTVGWYS